MIKLPKSYFVPVMQRLVMIFALCATYLQQNFLFLKVGLDNQQPTFVLKRKKKYMISKFAQQFDLLFAFSDDLLNYEAEDLLDDELLDEKIDEDDLLLSDEGKQPLSGVSFSHTRHYTF